MTLLKKRSLLFLNTHDGVIYIGVEDNGEICGITELDETMKKISDIISTGIMPILKSQLAYQQNMKMVNLLQRFKLKKVPRYITLTNMVEVLKGAILEWALVVEA